MFLLISHVAKINELRGSCSNVFLFVFVPRANVICERTDVSLPERSRHEKDRTHSSRARCVRHCRGSIRSIVVKRKNKQVPRRQDLLLLRGAAAGVFLLFAFSCRMCLTSPKKKGKCRDSTDALSAQTIATREESYAQPTGDGFAILVASLVRSKSENRSLLLLLLLCCFHAWQSFPGTDFTTNFTKIIMKKINQPNNSA